MVRIISWLKHFVSAPSCRIIQAEVDELTRQATYTLQVSGKRQLVTLSTIELVEHSKYYDRLHENDRLLLKTQYLRELALPQAYIFEYPITDEEDIVKIFVLKTGEMLCLSASALLECDDILCQLDYHDILKISAWHYTKLLNQQSKDYNQNNLIYLNK